MHSAKTKILGTLASVSALAGVAAYTQHTATTQVVQAATNYAPARSYGVDVSSFQSTNLGAHAQAGAQFAIVKVSEGTSYRNPNAAGQIASAKQHNMMPMAYHFATFGNNASAAQAEARYAISSAQAFGLPKGSYIVCDWETGDGNVVTGSKAANTNAIMAFMNTIKSAGYQPMVYSGAYLLRNNIDTTTLLRSYPNSLWVASYATTGRIDTPDFNYFPSMDGIAIWQFTDNWRGLYVDGNISLLPLSYNTSSSQAPSGNNSNNTASKPANKPSQPAASEGSMGQTSNSGSKVATVKYPGNIALWQSPNGHVTGRYLPSGSRWVVSGKAQVNGEWWYNLGGQQWVPGKYCYVTGFSSIPVVSVNSGSSNSSHTSSNSGETKFTGIGRVNYVPGYGINLWYGYGSNAHFSGRRLPHGSRWKVFKKVTVNGHTWYNLGGNQWLDGKYLIME